MSVIADSGRVVLPEPLIQPERKLWTPGSWPRDNRPGITRRGLSRRRCCPGGCKKCAHSSGLATGDACDLAVWFYGWSGTCASGTVCQSLQTKHFLCQQPSPPGTDDCLWRCSLPASFCDGEEIAATIYKDGTDYKLKVEVGDHLWQKNYGGTKPNVWSFSSESIPHVTSSGTCTSSSACTLDVVVNASADCSCLTCARCLYGTPEDLAIRLAGITDNGCGNCVAGLNDTFIATLDRTAAPSGDDCYWVYTFPTAVCGIAKIQLRMYQSFGLSQWSVRLLDSGGAMVVQYRDTTSNLVPCTTLDDESVPYDFTNGTPSCTFTGSTAYVSAT